MTTRTIAADRRRLILAALAIGVAGCAGRSAVAPESCPLVDWRLVGMADGLDGRPSSTIQRHVDVCSRAGAFPDVTAWRAGHDEGLALYCVPETAYRAGRAGLSFPSVCAPLTAPDLRAAWAHGRRWWELDRQIGRQAADLRTPAEGDMLLPGRRAGLVATLDRLRRERQMVSTWPPR